jgi:hypothetical protein
VDRADALSRLEALLTDRFRTQELLALVRRLEGGRTMVAELPQPPAPPVEIANALVELLEQRGQLGDGFLDTLARQRPLDRPLSPSVAGAPGASAPAARFLLRVIAGVDEGAVAPLSSGHFLVGRGSNADLDIRDAAFSRSQFRVVLDPASGRHLLLSAGSPAPVTVDGAHLGWAAPIPLSHGSVIACGDTWIRFEDTRAVQEQPL